MFHPHQAEAIKAETDAQKAYESFVKDTNASIEEKNRDITNKSAEKADAEADKVPETNMHAIALTLPPATNRSTALRFRSCSKQSSSWRAHTTTDWLQQTDTTTD